MPRRSVAEGESTLQKLHESSGKVTLSYHSSFFGRLSNDDAPIMEGWCKDVLRTG